MAPNYTEEVTSMPLNLGRRSGRGAGPVSEDGGNRDELFDDALRLIIQHDVASASFLQRKLNIGYARAARILDQMQQSGIVGPGEGSKPREILMRGLPADNPEPQQ